MAERKGSLIAHSLSKHAGRAKEKFLQNLGKVDRTADDVFDEYLENFNRQQLQATRLQKEFNNYIRCIRAAQTASKSLYDCINDLYETDWAGRENLYTQSESLEMLWQDLAHKLADQVLLPLNTYVAQFPEMKKKIDKRSRKLVDYDGQRHNMQSLEGGGGKKRDETKVLKAREQLQQAKRTYEMLNSELHDDLPALYHSRILFLVNNLQTLFSAEQVFHSETSKVYSEFENIIDKLATDSQKLSYSPRKITYLSKANNINSSSPSTPTPTGEELPLDSSLKDVTEDGESSSPTHSLSRATDKESPAAAAAGGEGGATAPQENGHSPAPPASCTEPPATGCSPPSSPLPASPPPSVLQNGTAASLTATNSPTDLTSTTPRREAAAAAESEDQPPAPAARETNGPTASTLNGNASPPVNKLGREQNNNKGVEDAVYDIPIGASTDNLPPGVLYKVKATYKYNREDVDELSFEVGEIIRVVAYDDPEEQEEGWLMGIKESTGEKGMFPANFTRPL